MQIVDIHEYMPVLQGILSEGRSVRFTVTGSSMSPFLIHERDSVIISPLSSPLKAGDIVFYQRDNGQYILHARNDARPVRLTVCIVVQKDHIATLRRTVRRTQEFVLLQLDLPRPGIAAAGHFLRCHACVIYAEIREHRVPLAVRIAVPVAVTCIALPCSILRKDEIAGAFRHAKLRFGDLCRLLLPWSI